MRKKLFFVATVLTLTIAASGTAMADWEQVGGQYKYRNPSGSYATDIIQQINGASYMFDGNGFMMTGWKKDNHGKWHYFDPASGAMAIGWKQIDGKWYYLKPSDNGAMVTGWLDLGNKRYYLDESGAMKQNQIFCTCTSTHVGDRYMYQASEDGSIIRQGDKKVNEHYHYIYMADGKIKMKDDLSTAAGIATGEGFYQYLYCTHDGGAAVTEQKEAVRSGIGDIMDEYADKYERDVNKAKYKDRAQKRQAWENKLYIALSEYIQDPQEYEDEIRSYINAVETSMYDGPDPWIEDMPL